MDNDNQGAPIIPAGTTKMGGGVTYDPLVASKEFGQAPQSPDSGKPQSAPEGTGQSSPDNAVGEPSTTFEELAAKKGFKSADDLAKAYANLESQNTRVEMGLSELIKLRSEGQPQEESVIEPENIQSNEDALKVVERFIKKHTQPLEDKFELQNLFMSSPDAKNYAPAMAQIVKTRPNISWADAYKLAKFDSLEKNSREAGRREAYQNIERKESATAAPARPTAARDTRPVDELIKDKSIPFAEVQRIMRERFAQ